MSFVERTITVQFDLANGQFEGGGNTATVTGLRCVCHVTATGGPSQSVMDLTIYGMPLSVMNQLSTVGTQYAQRSQNGITVLAGDADGESVVFDGVIFNAFVDALDMPDACFRVVATPGAYQAVVPAAPLSISGSADAAGMMSKLASQMGLQFENNGVSVKLANPYYAGTPWGQALAIAADGNFNMVVDRGVLVITPLGKPRAGDAVLISPDTGMVGYPAFVQNNIVVTSVFDPAVKNQGTIEVKSALTPANGQWQVRKLDYELESQRPHGRWFMTIEANPLGTL